MEIQEAVEAQEVLISEVKEEVEKLGSALSNRSLATTHTANGDDECDNPPWWDNPEYYEDMIQEATKKDCAAKFFDGAVCEMEACIRPWDYWCDICSNAICHQ